MNASPNWQIVFLDSLTVGYQNCSSSVADLAGRAGSNHAAVEQSSERLHRIKVGVIADTFIIYVRIHTAVRQYHFHRHYLTQEISFSGCGSCSLMTQHAELIKLLAGDM